VSRDVVVPLVPSIASTVLTSNRPHALAGSLPAAPLPGSAPSGATTSGVVSVAGSSAGRSVAAGSSLPHAPSRTVAPMSSGSEMQAGVLVSRGRGGRR
jgi:hypothetical protein